ncbi:hypothetical protein DFJ63DRAFT_313087 [Scheffersomyces coipomensis]|uniref:uncharacterized protein n=1 Tax=Scheffersomyces coipomensis TaxID=1788519 RepID=UPI00315CFACA
MLLKRKKKSNFLTRPEVWPLVQFIWHIIDLDIYDICRIFTDVYSEQFVEFLHGCNHLIRYRQHVVDMMCGRAFGFIFVFGDEARFLPFFNVIKQPNVMTKLLSIPNLHFQNLSIINTDSSSRLLDIMVCKNFEQLRDSFDEIRLDFIDSESDGTSLALRLSNLVKLGYNSTNLVAPLIETSAPKVDKLITIPRNIKELSAIDTIGTFSYSTAQFQNLTVLHFERFGIKEWHFYLMLRYATQLTTLKALNIHLKHLKVGSLPRKLVHLNVSDNPLSSIAVVKKYDWPQSLRDISIENCGLTNTMYFELFNFDLPPNLVTLDLNSNMFIDYSMMGKLPPKLESLKLGYRPMEENLQFGERNEDHKIFEYFLPNLKIFYVKNYRFRKYEAIEFPDSITEIGIQYSYIFGGQLFEKFPNNIVSLNFEGCNISAIYLDNLSTLQSLDLSHNSIESLQDIKLPINLKYLQISNNNIVKLSVADQIFNPKSCLQFKKLKMIDLRNNFISSINKKIGLPPNLKDFLLSNNKLFAIVIPRSMSNHQQLTRLDLSENRLITIRFKNNRKKGNAVNLKILDLSFNWLNRRSFPLKYKINIHKRIAKGFGKESIRKAGNVNSVHCFN